MRISSRPSQPNCTIEVPNYGLYKLTIETLGHGMNIVTNESISRHQRTLYPFVRTSGSWYIEAVFSDVVARNQFHYWLLHYVVRLMDQYQKPISPMSVKVPSEEFMKLGFPTSDIQFGDRHGTGIYRSLVMFTSASDPLVSVGGSWYDAADRDQAALKFYPGGHQSTSLPSPRPETVPQGSSADAVWDSGALGVPLSQGSPKSRRNAAPPGPRGRNK